jgi:hypothetical protein
MPILEVSVIPDQRYGEGYDQDTPVWLDMQTDYLVDYADIREVIFLAM